MFKSKISRIILLAGFVLVQCIRADTKPTEATVSIDQWLFSGSLSLPLPAFHQVADQRGEIYTVARRVQEVQIDPADWWPSEGDPLVWNDQQQYKWRPVKTSKQRVLSLKPSDPDMPQMTYLATYIEANRYVAGELITESAHPFKIWLNGQVMTEKTTTQDSLTTASRLTEKVFFETGKQLLLIKAVYDPQSAADWTLKASVDCAEKFRHAVTNTLDPECYMSIKHLLYTPQVKSVSVSPDGELVALALQHIPVGKNKGENWIELRRFSDGSPRQTFRGGMEISRLKWSPVDKGFVYTTEEDNKTTIWLVDLNGGTNQPLVRDIENLESFSWSPDGSFLVYTAAKKHPEQEKGMQLLDKMEQRQAYYRRDRYLYRVNVPQGTRHQLTAGKHSTNLSCFSPAGDKLLFYRRIPDYRVRPYHKYQFFVLDLADLSLDSLWTLQWVRSVEWSPRGKQLLVTGGPSLFGGVGNILPDRITPNDYDAQAFLYDLNSRAVTPLTRQFDPAIVSAHWSQTEKAIYFTAEERSCINLFRYDLRKQRFEKIDTDAEVIHGFDLAAREKVAVYRGSSADIPAKVYKLDFGWRTSTELFYDPAAKAYQHVQTGQVERWVFTNAEGTEIEGRIYYPPKFDRHKQYPCIVYYYGGTSPVTRDFGGRYPKNYWTANGYVVYVLQPSGATGFGQAFAAKHVNEWGTIVTDEIILGTQKFLQAHPFVDSTRVGCIGASYGGFTTELLITKTDLFAAAVSHAGISSIASYWGEGYWGYEYGAVANANRFPWTHPDYFLNQSALFNADQINTPLLLTHGGSDTNVPPGESTQLFTALKLLNKPVKLLEVQGQDHWIMKPEQRDKWSRSIVAWFDKWLKEQPEWWEALY